MRAHVSRWLPVALIGALVVIAGGQPMRAAADPLSQVVNCHDVERNIVQKRLRAECTGTILSDAEAAKVEEARRAYVRRALGDAPPRPPQRQGGMGRSKGIGSGFFVSGEGHVLTNYHVVAGCRRITVSPAAGQSGEATFVAKADGFDLALLRSTIRPHGIARFAASGGPRITDRPAVSIVGYPEQGIPPIMPLLTEGRIVDVARVNGRPAMVINAAIRPGNSGGPVLDAHGDVLGIVYAKVNTPGVYKRTGRVVRDVGFAVFYEDAKAFLRTLAVPYRTGVRSSAAVSDPLAEARAYVARIDCHG